MFTLVVTWRVLRPHTPGDQATQIIVFILKGEGTHDMYTKRAAKYTNFVQWFTLKLAQAYIICMSICSNEQLSRPEKINSTCDPVTPIRHTCGFL
jgi:fatty-acid desaturase